MSRSAAMKVACIGGGPGGLNFAIQLKRALPKADVTVYERNPRDDTYGWGVVLSDQTTQGLKSHDPETYARIASKLVHWDDIEIHVMGRTIRSSGHGFTGMGRQALLSLLQKRAAELGVTLRFNTTVEPDALAKEVDLLAASDGINSQTRAKFAYAFQPTVERRHCRFVWLGVEKTFDAFTFLFQQNEHGWFQAHAYPYDPHWSTFIVECDEQSWRNAGLDAMKGAQTVAYCQRLFAEWLDGKPLVEKRRFLRGGSSWLNFERVNNARWYHENIVLLGDSAHTAHFSVGSGTKLAIEDGIALAKVVSTAQPLPEALAAYEAERRIEVLRIQNAATNSMEWFENVRLKARLEPEQFAYSLLTRSQRVDHENMRLRDAKFLQGLEDWFADYAARRLSGNRAGGNGHGAEESGVKAARKGRKPHAKAARPAPEPKPEAAEAHEHAPPPMFVPFKLRGMELVNRVVVSPMAMYSAEDGLPGDFHMVHLGSRALGGAGLIFTEMTCVSPEGRITPGCAGMYEPGHAAAWRRIVEFIHAHTPAQVALQLGHSGPKGSTRVGWEGMEQPLPEGNWPVLGPSPVPWSEANQVPLEMGPDDMRRVKAEFARAAEMGADAGFDLLELHCAHGYLLSSFITPLTNRRADRYGGSLENRMRFPLEVFDAVRGAWPEARPMSVRISATDWVEGGIDIDDAVEVARLFREHGVDLIDVSAGQTSIDAKPVYGRMFQTPFSDRIRAELGVPTIAVGNIYDTNHVNSILMAGRADLCALARPHLSDPNWVQHAAAEAGYDLQFWPPQYLSGKEQAYRLKQRGKGA